MQGGQKDNAITRESAAELLTDAERSQKLQKHMLFRCRKHGEKNTQEQMKGSPVLRELLDDR